MQIHGKLFEIRSKICIFVWMLRGFLFRVGIGQSWKAIRRFGFEVRTCGVYFYHLNGVYRMECIDLRGSETSRLYFTLNVYH